MDENLKRIFCQILLNICINESNEYKTEYLKLVFTIYSEKIKNNIHPDFTFESPNDYILAALNINKISWARKFMETYSANIK